MNTQIINKLLLSFVFTLCALPSQAYNGDQNAPLTSSINCRIDLNNDGKKDIAILLQHTNGYGGTLFALVSNKDNYDAQELITVDNPVNLHCKYGKEIKETTASNLKGSVYKTNGAYILLEQLETTSFAFYWDENNPKSVKVSD